MTPRPFFNGSPYRFLGRHGTSFPRRRRRPIIGVTMPTPNRRSLFWILLYFGIGMELDRQHERERLLEAELLARQASLRALRFQLNPHFLFNALNAVSTLVSEGRAHEANTMLTMLSDFLRMTLDRPD